MFLRAHHGAVTACLPRPFPPGCAYVGAGWVSPTGAPRGPRPAPEPGAAAKRALRTGLNERGPLTPASRRDAAAPAAPTAPQQRGRRGRGPGEVPAPHTRDAGVDSVPDRPEFRHNGDRDNAHRNETCGGGDPRSCPAGPALLRAPRSSFRPDFSPRRPGQGSGASCSARPGRRPGPAAEGRPTTAAHAEGPRPEPARAAARGDAQRVPRAARPAPRHLLQMDASSQVPRTPSSSVSVEEEGPELKVGFLRLAAMGAEVPGCCAHPGHGSGVHSPPGSQQPPQGGREGLGSPGSAGAAP